MLARPSVYRRARQLHPRRRMAARVPARAPQQIREFEERMECSCSIAAAGLCVSLMWAKPTCARCGGRWMMDELEVGAARSAMFRTCLAAASRLYPIVRDLPARTADPAIPGSLSRHCAYHHGDGPGRNGARVGR
jgi:hypothetical protein